MILINLKDEYEVNHRVKILREWLNLTRDEFSKKTSIGSTQLANIEQKKQKAYAWHIQAIGKEWPQYAYWLVTGETIPEAGQISPELEETRKNLLKVG